jgi:DNA helicase-2/ATP-dependent DNA helicase PcrA
MVTEPSRFLKDLPPDLVASQSVWQGEETTRIAEAVYSWNRPTPAPTTPTIELKAGDRVRHAQFGEGVVVSAQPTKDDSEVVVAFPGTGVKKLLLSFAHLEKVE